MARIFLSYGRQDVACAHRLSEALNKAGHQVWWDHHIHGGLRYAEEIDRELSESEAVIVLWSESSIASGWVLDEAAVGRDSGRLIPVALASCRPPLGYRQFQTIDLDHEAEPLDVRELLRAIERLSPGGEPPATVEVCETTRRDKPSVCVLPFANMSGDAEQEYFSDGISEDITTDLSKLSALGVTARNTAFMFKGRAGDVSKIARTLGVTHVLEGSVRKAGERLRITAQLVDGSTGEHVWAERYDRSLTDIFAIQDEISRAIVDALKLKLLPQETKAIASRGTCNADAYSLYLKARQHWISGTYGTIRRDREIVRLCRKAVAVDAHYAQAWALMALAEAELRFWHGEPDDPLTAAERALALDPTLPEALCVKARSIEQEDQGDEASRLIQAAIELDPDSWEVNREAGRLLFREKRLREAIPHFEKAMSLMTNDFHSGDILMDCYSHIGDEESVRRVATETLPRCKAALADDPTNGTALAAGVAALLALGEDDTAKSWIERALLLDPDNSTMLYNLACPLTRAGKELELALDLFERAFATLRSADLLRHIQADPDVDRLRDHPRFEKAIAAAKARMI